eukprot:352063-Chlamydomonas_euryale.AAC.4
MWAWLPLPDSRLIGVAVSTTDARDTARCKLFTTPIGGPATARSSCIYQATFAGRANKYAPCAHTGEHAWGWGTHGVGARMGHAWSTHGVGARMGLGHAWGTHGARMGLGHAWGWGTHGARMEHA